MKILTDASSKMTNARLFIQNLDRSLRLKLLTPEYGKYVYELYFGKWPLEETEMKQVLTLVSEANYRRKLRDLRKSVKMT